MPTLEVVPSGTRRHVETPPEVETLPKAAVSAEQRYIQAIHNEIDGYMVSLKQLNSMAPDEVFQTLSSVSARLCEIRMILYRTESRRCTALRTREIDPLIEEVDRQFKFHSRLQAVRAHEWDMAKGQF